MSSRFVYTTKNGIMYGPFERPDDAKEDFRQSSHDDCSLWVLWEDEGQDSGEIARRIEDLKNSRD